MTLAIRMYFWDDAGWSASSSAVVVVTQTGTLANSGGGHHRHDEYIPLDDEFWYIRERYLKFLATPLPVTIKSPPTTARESDAPIPAAAQLPSNPLPPTFDFTKLNRYQSELSQAILIASTTKTLTELRGAATRIESLQASIKEANRLQEERRAKRKSRKRKLFSLAIELARLFN